MAEVREVVLNTDPDAASKAAPLRDKLTARLRVMTAADSDERQALEDAIETLRILSESKAKATGA